MKWLSYKNVKIVKDFKEDVSRNLVNKEQESSYLQRNENKHNTHKMVGEGHLQDVCQHESEPEKQKIIMKNSW